MNDIDLCSRREGGQGLVEFGIILVGVALAVILILSATGASLSQVYCLAVRGLGGQGCGCSFAFDDPSELEDWEGSNPEIFGVEDGKACITGDGKRARSFLNSCSTDFGANNFVVNVNGATVAYQAGNKNTGFDTWFRAQDDDNGYHFTYNSRANLIRFWKQVNGKWIRLAHSKVPADWGSQELNFKIVVEGDTFTAYKDGVVVLQATDSTYSEGKVGLRNKPSSKTCVDELTVDSMP